MGYSRTGRNTTQLVTRTRYAIGDAVDSVASAGSSILNFWKQDQQNQGAINQANAQMALQQQQAAMGTDPTTILLIGGAVLAFVMLRKKRHS